MVITKVFQLNNCRVKKKQKKGFSLCDPLYQEVSIYYYAFFKQTEIRCIRETSIYIKICYGFVV